MINMGRMIGAEEDEDDVVAVVGVEWAELDGCADASAASVIWTSSSDSDDVSDMSPSEDEDVDAVRAP